MEVVTQTTQEDQEEEEEFGGAIFVQEGGTLKLAGNLDIAGNSVAGGSAGGAGAGAGAGYGAGMFLQGNGTVTLSPDAGKTQTIGDVIADQAGVAGTGGSWQLVKEGAGTTILAGTNAYSEITNVKGGVLNLQSSGALGKSSSAQVASGAALELQNDIAVSAVPL